MLKSFLSIRTLLVILAFTSTVASASEYVEVNDQDGGNFLCLQALANSVMQDRTDANPAEELVVFTFERAWHKPAIRSVSIGSPDIETWYSFRAKDQNGVEWEGGWFGYVRTERDGNIHCGLSSSEPFKNFGLLYFSKVFFQAKRVGDSSAYELGNYKLTTIQEDVFEAGAVFIDGAYQEATRKSYNPHQIGDGLFLPPHD